MIDRMSSWVLAFDPKSKCTRVVQWAQAIVLDSSGKEVTHVEAIDCAAGWVDRYYNHKLKGWGAHRERGTFQIVVKPELAGRL